MCITTIRCYQALCDCYVTVARAICCFQALCDCHVTVARAMGKSIMSIFFTRHILQEPWKNIMFIFFTRHILQELLRKEKTERQFCGQLSREKWRVTFAIIGLYLYLYLGGGVWIFDRDSITGPHLTMREIVIISILKISQIPKLIRFRISVSILQTTHLTKDWGATGDSRVLGAPLSNTCGLSLEVSSAHCTKWCGTRIWDVDIHHHQRRSTSCTRS